MKLSSDQLETLLAAIPETEGQEIDCEEMLARAARFVESVSAGTGDLSDELREEAQHLRVCPECREEIEAILKAIVDS